MESPSSVTMGTVSHSHSVAKLLSQPHTYTSTEVRDSREGFDKYPVSLVSSAAPTSSFQHSDIKDSSESSNRLTIPPLEDQRFVQVSGSMRSERGHRMFSKSRQLSSWKDNNVSNRITDGPFPFDERDDVAAESDFQQQR